MTNLAQVTESARDLRHKIRRGIEAAEKGDVIDLLPVQAEVDSLCAALAALPKDESDAVQSDVIGLVEELSTLSDKLNQGLVIIRNELKDLSERQRAVSAYGKAP
ncbi:hypothetical protein [Denitrobaculum tricleocarpae]|uniref:Flagellar protein FliT n=1 Tax=Denitrobaculum tricleocarpae TaxID=2591009 RepID=A0A545T1Z9_9PROT|nr:hypothetical protein [Denitrobaculum tricleocarpae]TQV71257.1 hypothetical protein FKG95_26855 [Denitrobaculum tricleocarpae]